MNRRYLLLLMAVCLLIGCVQAWGVDMGPWDYRKEITVNNTGSNLTNYQVLFTVNRSAGTDSGSTVYLNGKCESDYDDIRFTTSDENTLCDYWIESSSSTVASIWVEVPSIVNSTAYGSTTMYLYYGNSGASAVSNGTNTFDFFDDFPGTSLDTTNKWTVDGATVTVADSVVTITYSASAYKSIYTKDVFGQNVAVRALTKTKYFGTSSSIREYWGFVGGGNNIIFEATDGSPYGGTFYQYNGVGEYTGVSGYSANTWAIIDIIRNPSTSDFYVNGANKKSLTTGIPTNNMNIAAYVYKGGTNYFNWILIRNYTATEPTVSAWGSEDEEFPRNLLPDFSGVPTSGYVPLTVYFSDASTAENCTINTWQWSFGDSTPNSTQQNPAHTYTTSGLYTVGLTATNTSFSKTNSTTKTAYINATVNLDAPNADFTVTETCGDVSDTFYFIDFSTGGGLYAWNWSFGDGAYSELRNPTHQYAGNGTYDVGLTVWGAYGNDTLVRNNLITIPCGAPTPTPTPTVTATPTPTYVYGNISVYRVEPNYIIWSVTENITSMVIDGYDVLVSGGYYGQYANVSPGTKHFACVNGDECISVVTPDDGISVLGNWIIYLVLIASCIVCARVPITCVFPVVMGVYLINVHLPSIGAPFEEYLLCAVLMIMGIISAIIGFTRR